MYCPASSGANERATERTSAAKRASEASVALRVSERCERTGDWHHYEHHITFESLYQAKSDAKIIPEKVLKSIPAPDIDSIYLPRAIIVRTRHLEPDSAGNAPENDAAEIRSLIDVENLPYSMQISQYEGRYVTIHAYIRIDDIDQELKPFLRLYCGLVYRTDLKRGNETISHEDVVMEMDRETNGYYAVLNGMGVISVDVEMDKSKFLLGLQYLREGLTQQVFTLERLRDLISFNNQSISSSLKSPYSVIDQALTPMLMKNESMARMKTMITHHKRMLELETDVKERDARETMAKFERITEFITDPQRLTFRIGGDLKSVAETLKKEHRMDLEAALNEYLGHLRVSVDEPLKTTCNQSRPSVEFPEPMKPGTALVKIMIMGSAETSQFEMVNVVEVPKDSPEFPVFNVVNKYIGMFDGPLWKQIRGLGLAYGFSFYSYFPSNMIGFTAYRAVDPVKVFQEMRKFINETAEYVDDMTLESAKAQIISGVISGLEKAINDESKEMWNCFGGRRPNHDRERMKEVQLVTKEDVKRVVKKYVQGMFDPTGSSKMIITTNPSKADQIVVSFRQMGFAVESVEVNFENLEKMD